MTTAQFRDLPLSDDIQEAIERAGYATPTPVQVAAVPIILAGRDVVIQSQTGTGKTAAFVLPIVELLTSNPGKIEALVLAPTRELAQQICREFSRLAAGRRVEATPIYGGAAFQSQYDALETAQVVVATPGRLLDLMRRGRINLDHVKIFGLDEADEMLSMGFERDVMDVIAKLPGKVQSFLCSATYNEAIRRIAETFIHDAEVINCSSDHIGAQSVQHVAFQIPAETKLDALRRLVATRAGDGAIVFCNTRVATFRAYEALLADGLPVDVLNGELTQAERERALARMRDGDIKFLVATDVAARGIDISGLPAVINCDMPETPEVYVHRTGRTGRAGQAGVAYSLVTPSDVTVFHALHKFFRLKFQSQQIATPEDVRRLRADTMLAGALGDLDVAGSLNYAGWIPAARRLLEHSDGPRIVAKLIAAFRGDTVRTDVHGTLVALDSPPDAPTDAPQAPALPPVREKREAPAAPAAAEPVETRAPRRAAAAPQAAAVPSPAPVAASEAQTSAGPAPSTSAEAGLPVPDAAAGLAPNAVFSWLLANTQIRNMGRFHGWERIVADTGLTRTDVEALADGHPLIEASRGASSMWRLRRAALPPRDAATPRPPREGSGTAEATTPVDAPVAKPVAPAAPVALEPPAAEAAPAARKPRREREERRRPGRERPAPNGILPDRARVVEPPRMSTPSSTPAAVAPSTVLTADDAEPARKGWTRIGLNVHPDQVLDPERLIQMLFELAGLDREDFGQVHLKKGRTVVEVNTDYGDHVISAVSGRKIGEIVLELQRLN